MRLAPFVLPVGASQTWKVPGSRGMKRLTCPPSVARAAQRRAVHVVHGLEAGDPVVTAGSFLLDAETRLSGGLAAVRCASTKAQGGPSP
jgi:hypothetical protein